MALSPQDIEHARKNLSISTKFFRYGKPGEGMVLNVDRLEYEVEDFVNTYVGGYSDLVKWSAEMLFMLSDQGFTAPKSIKTMDELRAAFEAHLKESQEEFMAQVEDDPAYAKYAESTGRLKGNHHWGDDTVDACRCWLYESHYQVWYVKHVVEEEACDAVRDILLAMACEEDKGAFVARKASEAFDKEADRLLLKYAAAWEAA